MGLPERPAWEPLLGLALAVFWVWYYALLVREQPVPDGLPASGLLPGRHYGRAPPFPAVEWNVWQGWRDALPLQAAFYAAFLLARRATRPAGDPALLCVGLASCVVLRGVGGAALTIGITACAYAAATRLPRRLVLPVAWAHTLLLMQAVFVLLSADSPEEPCLLECWAPALAPLRLRGVAPWSTFRYDALRLISFAGDVAGGEAAPNLLSLLAYQLYPPLLAAGPIIGYADFVAQRASPHPWPARQLAAYALRTLGIMCLIEASLHLLYVPAWLGPDTPPEDLRALSPWVLFGSYDYHYYHHCHYCYDCYYYY